MSTLAILTKCPLAKCPLAKCRLAKCPLAKCHGFVHTGPKQGPLVQSPEGGKFRSGRVSLPLLRPVSTHPFS